MVLQHLMMRYDAEGCYLFEHKVYVKVPSGVQRKGTPAHKLKGSIVYIREGVTYVDDIFRGIYDEIYNMLIYYNPLGIFSKPFVGVVATYEMSTDDVNAILYKYKEVLDANVLPAGMRTPIASQNNMKIERRFSPKRKEEITVQDIYSLLK